MYKPAVLLWLVFCVLIEARPKWQFLPPRDGYIPVYIRPGDTPLEEINPDLAEAFHALPVGRSSGKHLEAAEDVPEDTESSGTQQVDPVEAESSGKQQQDAAHVPEETQSSKKLLQASPEVPELPKKVKEVDAPESIVDKRPYEKKLLEKKKKATELSKPERS